MKWVLIFFLMIVLTACDYQDVMKEYKRNSPHAKDLLLHGYNSKVDCNISSILIERALDGDEEAKLMIYAQIEVLRGMPSRSHSTFVMPMPVRTGR